MSNGQDGHRDEKKPSEPKSLFTFQSILIIIIIISIGYYLITEHRTHLTSLLGWLPFILLILLCPLMHMMHGGHGTHGSHKGKHHHKNDDEHTAKNKD